MSESAVFCRNRGANMPDFIDYTSLLGHYQILSVGARYGSRLRQRRGLSFFRLRGALSRFTQCVE